MNSPDSPAERLTSFQIVILVLSVYVLGALAAQTVLELSPELNMLLDTVDNVICLIFLGDFVYRYAHAERKREFLKWGWIDFVSSIPNVSFLRWGRAFRVVRIFRLLRTFRSARLLSAVIYRNRARGTISTVVLLSILLIICAAIAVLNFERAPDSNIRSSADALWWAMSTITTVGFGDLYPVTAEGRIAGVILMLVGITVFSVFTAAVASSFVERKEEGSISELVAEVKLLREKIESFERNLDLQQLGGRVHKSPDREGS